VHYSLLKLTCQLYCIYDKRNGRRRDRYLRYLFFGGGDLSREGGRIIGEGDLDLSLLPSAISSSFRFRAPFLAR